MIEFIKKFEYKMDFVFFIGAMIFTLTAVTPITSYAWMIIAWVILTGISVKQYIREKLEKQND